MTNIAPLCCCENTGEVVLNDCEDICSLPSTLAVNALSGSYEVSRVENFTAVTTPPCTGCLGGVVQAGALRNFFIKANWLQTAPIVLTRYGTRRTGCCYYGYGMMTMRAELTYEQIHRCCTSGDATIPVPRADCRDVQTYTRTLTNLPFCMTITCDVSRVGCGYTSPNPSLDVHVAICDFWLAPSVEQFKDQMYQANGNTGCLPGAPCQLDPPRGAVMNGIVYGWTTALRDPRYLDPNQRGQLPLIGPYQRCFNNAYQDLIGGDTTGSCMDQVYANQVAAGPFAVKWVDEFQPGVDDPAPCTQVITSGLGAARAFDFVTSYPTQCGVSTNWLNAPCWGLECSIDCIESSQAGGVNWPQIT